MINELLDFYEGLHFDRVPADVVSQAKRCLLDWIGVTLAGMAHPASSIMRESLLELGGAEQASILGTTIKTSAPHAALINGTASHVLDYDDTHLEALMHPSVTIIPAALALGESQKCSGRQFLHAYLLGFEIETRISMAMGAPHYDAGWHSTSTMGRFGAAAAASKILGLNRKHTAHAIGLAGTQACGIRKVFGTMAKSFHPGKAAADGLLAALLAGKGFTCSEDIFSGEKGLGVLLSSDFDSKRALKGLGQYYTIMGISIKPFASCLYTHPAIDGILRLREEHALIPEQVKRIHCRVSKFCADAACQLDPQDELAGKFSTPYCIALALIKGEAGEQEFCKALLFNPQIRALMKRITVESSADLKDEQAELKIELTDGRTLEKKIDYPLGDPRKPLSDEDVERKFRGVTTGMLTAEKADRVIKGVKNFDSFENIEQFVRVFP